MRARCGEEKYDFAYGYYQRRRREQAILVQHACAGRLLEAARSAPISEKCLYSHVTTLRDIANAFPSVSHDFVFLMLRFMSLPWGTIQLILGIYWLPSTYGVGLHGFTL